MRRMEQHVSDDVIDVQVDTATSVTNNSTSRMDQLRCQVESAREAVHLAFDQFKVRLITSLHMAQLLFSESKQW